MSHLHKKATSLGAFDKIFYLEDETLMKKRILALALAGTTAFSVFGALNVSAARHGADTTEQYNAYEMIEDIVINGTGDAKWVTVDGESMRSISPMP